MTLIDTRLTDSALSRRGFLRLSAAGLFSASAVSILTAACSVAPVQPTPAAPRTSGAPGGARLPSYLPVSGPAPDLPGTRTAVDQGFLTYSKTLFKSVKQIPGQGGDVNVLTRVQLGAPTPLDQNPAWQAVNKAVGANMKLNMVSGTAELNTKLATTIAGGDIPDMMTIPNLAIQGLTQFLQAGSTDLTPYIGGDAIRDYPNLANIPTIAWKQTVIGSGIFGVPVPRPVINGIWFVNQSRFDPIGAAQPKDAADFKRILLELTQPQAGQWGITGDSVYAFGMIGITAVPQLAMFGVPNNWRADAAGTLVKDFETEEYRAALGYVRDLWASGVYNPDSPTATNLLNKQGMVAGKYAVYPDGWFAYTGDYWDKGLKAQPPVKFRALRPFSHDGGKPIWHQFQGFAGMTAIKKSTPDRAKELLRILDYLAAPFGSEEAHLLEYGVKDVDHTLDAQGNPVLTQKGLADTVVSWRYLTMRPSVLFDPNDQEFARVAHADMEAVVPVMVSDPTLGLISATDQTKGGQLLKTTTDAIAGIVAGRSALADLDQLIKDWRANGGDQIRTEYQQALQASTK